MENSSRNDARDPLDHDGLKVPARTIPVPRSVSPEAQEVLSAAARLPMVWAEYPALDDVEGWIEYRRTADENMARMFGPMYAATTDLDILSIRLDGAEGYRVSNPVASQQSENRVLLHIHGGALVAGGGQLCRVNAAVQCLEMDALVYAADYRMPPHHPYPVPLDDCLRMYRHVLAQHPPEQIVVHGSSAGGNLAAATMLRGMEEGLALPAGLILETPELDLTESGDSFETNRVLDHVLQKGLMPINRLYAGGAELSDPHLSPLFGKLAGFPPTLLTAGTRDLFLSNAVRMHHRLRAAEVPAELLVYEAMPHGGFFGTPDDAARQRDVRKFADRCWLS